jgi:pimeloyl-ACP methyl ester carboxylesterase
VGIIIGAALLICLLAKDRPLRALILESTFPAGPILVIHGRQDQLIPWQQGQRLAAASSHSTFKLYDCGHGCWDPERLPFWQDALPFLKDAGMLDSARQ